MNYEDNIISNLSSDVQRDVSLVETIKWLGGRVENEDGVLYTECHFHYPRGSKTVFIDSEQNRFECTKCKFRGTVIAWTMYIQGVDLVEALAILAKRNNIAWESQVVKKRITDEKKKRSRILSGLVDQYKQRLEECPDAMDYVTKERDMNDECLHEFDIGWCDDAISQATPMSRVLWRYGVLGRMTGGQYFNRFANRVIFPIRDEEGYIRGFGGRTINDEVKGAKYLNSGTSRHFNKQDILYGLYETLQRTRTPDRILVVEGYMDVTALHRHGFHFAVGTLGTAICSIQILNALKYTDHLTFCFDSDSAGSAATLKAISESFQVTDTGHVLDVVSMPSGYDPDNYISEFGADGFNTLLSEATPVEDWLLVHAIEQSLGTRRCSRSDGKRNVDLESDVLEVGTRARVGKYIKEFCASIDTEGVRDGFIASAESTVGTKL